MRRAIATLAILRPRRLAMRSKATRRGPPPVAAFCAASTSALHGWGRRVKGGGRAGRVWGMSSLRVGWPCPTWALAVAAQEVGWGLRRLIPDRGNAVVAVVPGALLERAACSSVGGADARIGVVRRSARAR